jgi:transcriptional regulator with XRE-family HTH domain
MLLYITQVLCCVFAFSFRIGQDTPPLNREIFDLSLSDIFRVNLKRVLKTSGTTQGELARRIGWTRQYANQLVNAKNDVNLQTIQKIAGALSVPAWSLLQEESHTGATGIQVDADALTDIWTQVRQAVKAVGLNLEDKQVIQIAVNFYRMYLETGELLDIRQVIQFQALQKDQ